MKSILLIGLGRFGRHLAAKLKELHHQVLAVDVSEERVNEALKYVTHAQIGDSTNEDFVASLGVRDFDVCIVAIGDDFQSSLETTDLLKVYGARTVVARASQDVQAKFLLRCGADEVIYPEKQVANWTAVRYSSENIFDYVALTSEYSIYEIAVPRAWAGRTIANLSIRQRYDVSVLATKKGGTLYPMPAPSHEFHTDETVLIMGSNESVAKLVD
ncbi:MAG: TrkA family potassium uptake protein [Oscillospiraceae bacterium]|nr:TrkA family potassium uptake protein [Oscillospiraceae bacterium]